VVSEDSVRLRRAGESLTVRFDTLAIVDTGQSPSLREGGFVADQVQRYNAIQRRRVRDVRDRFARRGMSLGPLVDLREKENASVFRTRVRFVDDSSGERYQSTLSARAATTGMRVASPFESRREVMITARRAHDPRWPPRLCLSRAPGLGRHSVPEAGIGAPRDPHVPRSARSPGHAEDVPS
jgi:hypothetical protein